MINYKQALDLATQKYAGQYRKNSHDPNWKTKIRMRVFIRFKVK